MSNHTIFDQLLSVQVANILSVRDFLVHHRLGKGRLILLIMPVSSVTDDIDKDVLVEFLSVPQCHLQYLVDELRLVCVYVDDGGLD